MPYAIYNKIILITLGVVLIPLFSIMFYMEPLNEELTRMGGYLENDYGWNSPQEHFPKPLFKLAKSFDDYNKYYDVVVIGDSFSNNESSGWQNYFVNETGLSLISFDMKFIGINEILNSSIFKDKPPKIFIYESVERNILSRHPSCNSDRDIRKYNINLNLNIQPLNANIEVKYRSRESLSIEGLNVSSAINYTKKSISRNIFGMDTTEITNFKLNKSGMFSSDINDSLLILNRDFKLMNATAEKISIAQCSLLAMQSKIRKSNKTEFVALIFPDKTTVYSEYFIDKTYSNISIIDRLERTKGLNITSLVNDYKSSVKNGAIDFYLPNDSHCGYMGYKLAGKALFKVIKRLNSVN